MDRQGRGDIDPADQWVIDPATGTYQLRLEAAPEADAPAVGLPRPRDRGPTAPREPGRRPPSAADARRTGRPGVRQPGTRQPGTRQPGSGYPGVRQPGVRRPGPGRPPMSARRKRALTWTASVTCFLLIAACVSGYLVYRHFNGNITTVDVGDAGSKDVVPDGPLNVLVIGTDSRQGLGRRYGDADNIGHADTTILFHVSADRSNATAMSIPRDIVTGIPDCPTKQKDGSTRTIPGTPAGLTTPKFNESLGVAGRDPGCTMRAVTQLTGIPVQHFMMVNFEAVKTLSTAVGGVDVCLARPLVDPKSHLDLAAGPHSIKGEQALEFVRTRHALRNQSDLDRIKLQQTFIGSMIRKIKSGGTLTSPTKLYTLANAATKALTVDSAIGSVSRLTSLAKDLSKVDTKHITFTTLPVVDNPNEKVHATVVVDRTRAPRLFSLIRDDVSLTRTKRHAATDRRLLGPRAAAADVRVRVLNGSGITGGARGTAAWLAGTRRVGHAANGGNAPAPAARTTLEYAPDQAEQARALAAMMGLPGAALRPGAAGAAPEPDMTLTLGADFVAPGVPIASTTAPDDLQKTEADNSACVG